MNETYYKLQVFYDCPNNLEKYAVVNKHEKTCHSVWTQFDTANQACRDLNKMKRAEELCKGGLK